jgi:succinate-acetate transporter protein
LITSTQYINSVTKAGGIFGALTAFIAYYIGLSELLSSEDVAIVHLPLGIIPKRIHST